MKQFALLGYPLTHSLSPEIHSEIAKTAGITLEYNLMSLNETDFENQFHSLKERNGFNVTIPYKTKIIKKLDTLHESALAYGAVNTVSNNGGKLVGYNTDVDGFLQSIALLKAPLHKKVLLLGAGGAARVMARETLKQGGRLTVAVRNPNSSNAASLKKELLAEYPNNVSFCSFTHIAGHFDTLLNATPVGMYPNTENCPVSDGVIQNCDFVFDSIYNPKETVLLQKARNFNKQALGGMAMLVWQAVVAQQIWNGISLTDTQVQTIIKKMQEKFS